MNTHKNKTYFLILAIALTLFAIPLILYRLFYGRTSQITPSHAKVLLTKQDSDTILIDVRTSDEFNSAHIFGSEHWALNDILSTQSENKVPEQFRDKTLLLICSAGVKSTKAAKHLNDISIKNAISVRGGIQEWIASIDGPETKELYTVFEDSSGQIIVFPLRVSPMFEKILAIISGFVIKPTYTILSLVLIIILWEKREPDLSALRWSMIFFFIGENFCAINYTFFKDTSYFIEYLHSFGMLLSFTFAAYAVFEGMDRRILMLSEPDKKCAAIGLCIKCIKYENVPCGLRRTFLLIIPASIILALMPLMSEWYCNSYNTMIFGTFYNYTHRIIYQQFEKLCCPVFAIIFLSIAFLILVFKKDNSLLLPKIFFAAGIGTLGFGTFRTISTSMYNNNLVWFNFWEEATELLFIVGVCFVLWLFHNSLLKSSVIDK
jgi:rhodanese-related sulfurtransferase